MIELSRVSFWYDGASDATLCDVDLSIGEGELVVVTGRTGAGKSTLLGTLNGLVPHFTGGHLEGTVHIDGAVTSANPPRELAHLVGVVGQDPLAGFVTDVVEDELAYGMEQFGLEPQAMRRRVEETLDLLGIADLRRRSLRTLSGGQQQRVAIGSVLTMHPPVLVLDEPTSALDPTAAEDVLATLSRLVTDLGTTVVLAEHRLERVVPFADRMFFVDGRGRVNDGAPADVLANSPVAPPLIELGRYAGWDPLPLSVRDARRHAVGLRGRLSTARRPVARARATGEPLLRASDVVVRYGTAVAVRKVDLEVHPGSVVALMGRNGSGKSSLLWALQGSGPRHGGEVSVDKKDPKSLSRRAARTLIGLVPQTASDLLYLESVAAECAAADAEAWAPVGTCRALLEELAPDVADGRHPRDLSEGQKLSLVLAIQLTAGPRVLLLDEPTRGLDYAAKTALAGIIGALRQQRHAVVVATHDVELVAAVADDAVVMSDGEVVANGAARDVLGGSPAFAPQTAKVLGPDWLTVDQVRQALS